MDTMKKERRQMIVAVIWSTTLLAIMGVASITPVFPVIREQLQLSSRQVALLITFFTLPGVVLPPLYGVIIDRYSRKKVLVGVLVLYGVFGSCVALTKRFELMLLFRFLQGMGNAPLTTLSLTMIGDRWKGEKRAAMMGYNAGILGIGTALFPVIGGSLAALAWNSPFLLAAVALVIALAAVIFMHDIKPREGEADTAVSVKEYFLAALQEMKKPRFIGLYLTAFMAFLILYGSFLAYFPFFLADRYGLNSAAIGGMISAMSLTTAAAAALMGKLTRRWSGRQLMRVAFLLYAASLIALPFINDFALLFPAILLFGAAQGLSIPVVQLKIAENAPPGQRAVLMSFFSVVMNGGASLGPLLTGLCFSVGGFPAAFGVGAVLAGTALLITFLMLRDV